MVKLVHAAVFAALIASAAFVQARAQSAFPYDHDLVFDARPMPGSKRVPILMVAESGAAQIDLWCKRGAGQAVIAGDTITIIIKQMNDEPCSPERAQADQEMLSALEQVTTWSLQDEVVTLAGPKPLRFRVATN